LQCSGGPKGRRVRKINAPIFTARYQPVKHLVVTVILSKRSCAAKSLSRACRGNLGETREASRSLRRNNCAFLARFPTPASPSSRSSRSAPSTPDSPSPPPPHISETQPRPLPALSPLRRCDSM